MTLMDRRRGLMAMGASAPTLKKLVTINADNIQKYSWTLTDEAKECGEFYIFVDITLSSSAAFNVCYNYEQPQDKVGQFGGATTINSSMVILRSKAAEIDGTSFSERAYGSSTGTIRSGTLTALVFRPNSTTITFSGTIEVWGWV